MFGGYGIFMENNMLVLILDNDLYTRVDEEIPAFVLEDSNKLC